MLQPAAYTASAMAFFVSMCESPKELAAAFACVVTAPSKSHMDWVARNGGESLFQALNQILPEVFRFSNFVSMGQKLDTHVCMRRKSSEKITRLILIT